MVPVLVRSAIISATPINGAISVDPLNSTILAFIPLFLRYLLVKLGNSVATNEPSTISPGLLIGESSGTAKTSFALPKFRSSSISTDALFSSIRSRPVIPISAAPSATNSGISAALVNITLISLS